MNNEYKTIPFADVKIGQQFDDGYLERFTHRQYIKTGSCSYKEALWHESLADGDTAFPDGCLVRTADCEPELDTCTWTYKEYAWESACGAEFIFTDEQDSLELNSFKFCHKCGCKIVEAK